MRKQLFLLVGLVAATSSASAVTIDFESVVSPGDFVTNQFPEATFSSVAGIEFSYVEVIGPPILFANYVRTTPLLPGVDPGGTTPVFIDFTVPVDNLTFALVASEATSETIVNVLIFHSGGESRVPIAGNNDLSFHKRTIDAFSGFTAVTRIELPYTGANVFGGNDLGVAWDDFSFEPIPEPSTAILLLGGITAIASRRRLCRHPGSSV